MFAVQLKQKHLIWQNIFAVWPKIRVGDVARRVGGAAQTRAFDMYGEACWRCGSIQEQVMWRGAWVVWLNLEHLIWQSMFAMRPNTRAFDVAMSISGVV